MITAQERERLSKLLGMLGSEFDGERATAAAMISKMAKAKKITIPDLCLAPVSHSYQRPNQDTERPYYKKESKPKKEEPPREDHSEFIKAARYIKDNYMHLISEWEQSFVSSIADKKLTWNLSYKQTTIMERVIKAVTKAVDEGATRADYVDLGEEVPF